MGLIKTAIMTGGGLYAVNKLAKTCEVRQNSRSPQPANRDQQREYRDYPAEVLQGAYRRSSPPQQTRQLAGDDGANPQQEQYWYLSSDNVWTLLPREYSNMRSGPIPRQGSPYEEQQQRGRAAPYPTRQQQLEFGYPQDQNYGYVEEERSPVPSDAVNQAMGFISSAVQAKSGGKKGKKDGAGDILSMFSN